MPFGIGRTEEQGKAFAAEVERLRAEKVPGATGRLRELFDFLADRGADAESASQAEIAELVFGQNASEGDDATVRVYIHRLRKRLEDFYATEKGTGPRLQIPAGTYALRLQDAEEADDGGALDTAEQPAKRKWLPLVALGCAVALALTSFFLGRNYSVTSTSPPANALWEPFLHSKRPTLIVLGDYYIFGEIDPMRPEEGRLIRDFRVNSPTDLVRMQDMDPDQFGDSEDVGLNYLPFSSAYGMEGVMPILARTGRQVSIIAASQLEPDMLNYFDVVYIGLFSGMHLLEDVNFMDSRFQIGETYDELIEMISGKSYTSEEARRLASPAYYRDYGYVARFRSPGGALIAVIAGERETGLRGIAPLISGAALPAPIERVAGSGGAFEALYQITGQQGADLSEKLIVAEPRP